MDRVIREAVALYPFSDKEKWLIEFNKNNDFNFLGDELLMRHILFNLIKNALYSIKEANKGIICISMSIGNKFNIVHVKDTGKGMTKDIKDKIFNKFYSHTKYGSVAFAA